MLFLLWSCAQLILSILHLLLDWMPHEPRSKGSPCKHTAHRDQGRDGSLNFQKKTWNVQIACSCKRVCDWAKCLFQTLHSPVRYFHLTGPFLTGSSSALTQLQEVWGLWPHVLHTPLLVCCVNCETEPLWPGRTGSSIPGAQCFPSYLPLSNPKWYSIFLGQIVIYNICGSLRSCNFFACFQVACSDGRGMRKGKKIPRFIVIRLHFH